MNLQTPQLRLDFYHAAVVLSRWTEDGRLTSYPVSVHDVVSACAQVELSSGLLPPDTLFWKQQAQQIALGVFVPARHWRVQLEAGAGRPPVHYHLPMPPFIFAGCGTTYRLFAVKRRPQSARDPLYHAPCPNVHTAGSICQGDTPFPACSPQTMQPALQLFLEGSSFNGDLSRGKCRAHPEDVCQLWAKLDDRKRFPLSELVPAQMTLQTLL